MSKSAETSTNENVDDNPDPIEKGEVPGGDSGHPVAPGNVSLTRLTSDGRLLTGLQGCSCFAVDCHNPRFALLSSGLKKGVFDDKL